MPASSIRRILVPLDGSPLAERVVPHAALLAQAFGAEILLLCVLAPERRSGQFAIDSALWRLRRVEAESHLNGLVSRLQSRGLTVQAELSDGIVEDEILSVAGREGLDLIALTTHGRGGPSRFGLGGTVSKVISRAGLSVLLVRGGAEAAAPVEEKVAYGRVLVPVDTSHRSDWAVNMAAAVARASGAELLVAHVVQPPAMSLRVPGSPEHARLVDQVVQANREAAEEYLESVKTRLSAPDLPVRTELLVSPGVPRALSELITRESVGLVVVAAHGASGPAEWPYGGVVEKLIVHGTTPLFICQDLHGQRPDEGAADLSFLAHTGNGWPR